MRRLLIIYQMVNATENTETCVTLPMTDEAAADILKRGERSEHLSMMLCGELYRALKSLSALQGYEYDGFCSAKEVK